MLLSLLLYFLQKKVKEVTFLTSKPPSGHSGKLALGSPTKQSAPKNNEPYQVPPDQDVPSFDYGDKVVVRRENQQLQYATVKFCGYTQFCEGIFWYGVVLDQANGKNDGSVQVLASPAAGFHCLASHAYPGIESQSQIHTVS